MKKARPLLNGPFGIRGAQTRTKRQESRFAQPQVARRVTAMDGRDESNSDESNSDELNSDELNLDE